MIIRPLELADLPYIYRMYDASGFPYEMPHLGRMEAIMVIEQDGEPIMAAGAEKICQLYLWASEMPPTMKLHGIRMLHDGMATALREKHYTEANAFLPPSIAKRFGRRLMRSFGWLRNWESFAVRF